MGEGDVRSDDVSSILTHFCAEGRFPICFVWCVLCALFCLALWGGWFSSLILSPCGLWSQGDNIKLVKSSVWERKVFEGGAFNIESVFVLNVDEL